MNRYYLAIALEFAGGASLITAATLLPNDYRIVAVAIASVAGSVLHSGLERLADLLEARQIARDLKKVVSIPYVTPPTSIPQGYKN